MPSNPSIQGVIPAALLPRDAAGTPLWREFASTVEFLLSLEVSGVCVNGATGEYVAATPAERREAVRVAREIAGPGRLVISGVGAVGLRDVLSLARESEEAGADALLVPAPHFFKYRTDDLDQFYREVARQLRVPALLYNLAAFTGALAADLSVRLIREVDKIIGIKDSSGEVITLERLSAPPRVPAVRLVGHDRVLAECLSRGLCDGVISGVASVLPELTLAMWKTAHAGPDGAFASVVKEQHKLLSLLDPWPVPWGLKIIGECRGLAQATFPLPLSADRKREIGGFREKLESWWSGARPVLSTATNLTVEAQPATSATASTSSN